MNQQRVDEMMMLTTRESCGRLGDGGAVSVDDDDDGEDCESLMVKAREGAAQRLTSWVDSG
jgi:hypothetical protein